MPRIGEVTRAKEITRKGNGSKKYIWSACIICGKERWVQLWLGEIRSLKCQTCGCKTGKNGTGHHRKGKDTPNWKGGRIKAGHDYMRVKLYPDDFFYSMARQGGYVLEHRLVVAKALNRCLLPWEVVHHKAGYAKDENRYPETLELITDKRFHMVDMQAKASLKRQQQEIGELQGRVTILEAENAFLGIQKLEGTFKLR